LPSNQNVVGSSTIRVIVVSGGFTLPSSAVRNAAAYTNGLKIDPGCRRASARFNWLCP
jgi:hypothetical protein